jgi:hypothetical protein
MYRATLSYGKLRGLGQRPFGKQTPRAFHFAAPKLSPFGTTQKTDFLNEFQLKNKVIVVTGGARGLGLVQAEALLEAGAHGE